MKVVTVIICLVIVAILWYLETKRNGWAFNSFLQGTPMAIARFRAQPSDDTNKLFEKLDSVLRAREDTVMWRRLMMSAVLSALLGVWLVSATKLGVVHSLIISVLVNYVVSMQLDGFFTYHYAREERMVGLELLGKIRARPMDAERA